MAEAASPLRALSPSTADFVKEAVSSDMFEIQASQLAAKRANELTKAFASQMITDHQKTSNEIEVDSSKRKVGRERSIDLDSSHQKMLDKLKGVNDADFTKQYDKDHVSAHKDAVSCLGGMQKAGTLPR